MPRVYLSIDEQSVLCPVATLHVCSRECMLSEQELGALLNEILWAKDAISRARAHYYTTLANKYKQVEEMGVAA